MGLSCLGSSGIGRNHSYEQTKGSPTFVNIDKPYPNQPFTILVWGEDLQKFSPKPSTWEGKRVCATGTISTHAGKPEIVAKGSGQVTVEESKAK